MIAVLVFILATFDIVLGPKKVLDGRGLFGGSVLKNVASPDFFFKFLLSNCLNWKIYCDDHSPLS